MSVVTNVLLTAEIDDLNAVEQLNVYLEANGHNGFKSLDEQNTVYAGTKLLECEVYPGAFNHLHIEGFIEAVRTAKWDHREITQLFIKKQYDDKFREIELWSAE